MSDSPIFPRGDKDEETTDNIICQCHNTISENFEKLFNENKMSEDIYLRTVLAANVLGNNLFNLPRTLL